MKKFINILTIAGLTVISNLASADKISGSPKADFKLNELSVPCVLVKNFDQALDGQYFDVIFKRRGNSFNYELTFADTEDSSYCLKVNDYAKFEDDDYDDSDDDDSNDDSSDDNSSDDNSSSTTGAKIFIECESRSNRSKVSVNGNNLVSGDYSARITSGGNEAISEIRTTIGDEVEFDFDSAADDIAAGATEIDANFIDTTTLLLTGQILDSGNNIVAEKDVNCSTN